MRLVGRRTVEVAVPTGTARLCSQLLDGRLRPGCEVVTYMAEL
jgi:hypothetical protein